MPLLPEVWGKLIVNCKWLIVSLLIAITFTIFPSSALAQGAPNPQPCQDALFTDQLTKSIATPVERTYTKTGPPNSIFNIQENIPIKIDFSALEAVFADSNSDYLGSDFDSETYRKGDIINASPADLNAHNGPAQKIVPKVMVDDLKVKYVNYVYSKPVLAEAGSTYTDIENGGFPKTIYDLVNEYGLPAPSEGGEDDTLWFSGWGRYWAKIPTAVNEFFYGKLAFPIQYKGIPCPQTGGRIIYFILPEYYRTANLSNQLNLVMVPREAQSTLEKQYNENFTEGTLVDSGGIAGDIKTAVSDVIDFCIKPFMETSLAKALRKVVKISFDFLNPIKDVYAYAVDNTRKYLLPDGDCVQIIPTLSAGKQGSAPFCTLPVLAPDVEGVPVTLAGQRQIRSEDGESCTDLPSANKLDNGSQVVCTFIKSFNDSFKIPDDFDTCIEEIVGGVLSGNLTCTVAVRVYPTFYIPWLGRIWNNTTYSEETDSNSAIYGNPQQTGRPGLYGFFTPRGVESFVFAGGKNFPSETVSDTTDTIGLRQRYSGAFECNKQFVKDIALKPKVLQEVLGIRAGC